MSHNYIKGGSKGNCTPEYGKQTMNESGFTVGGEPEMLGRDGKADPKDDLDGHAPTSHPGNDYARTGSSDPAAALAEIAPVGKGTKYSSLQGGGKTSLPTGEAGGQQNKKPTGKSGD